MTMFVVIAHPLFGGIRVHGPYPSAARASGAALNRYGPIVFGGTAWWVVPLRPERDHG